MSVRHQAGRALRRLYYPLYHNIFIWYWGKNNIKVAKKIAHESNVPLLSISDLSSYKRSDTLFVLGSGSSINSLTHDDWKIIKNNDSIGFNYWTIHDHVPTYYCFEVPEENDRSDAMAYNLKLKIKEYHNIPLIIKDVSSVQTPSFIKKLPNNLINKIMISLEISIPGTTVDEFNTSLKIMHDKNLDKLLKLNIIPKKRASLSYILFLAIILKYKKIVLCGVDLNNTKYFYEDKIDYYSQKGLKIPGTVHNKFHHKTIDPEISEITIDKVILGLNEFFLKKMDMKLFIGSKKSLLYPMLPCFF